MASSRRADGAETALRFLNSIQNYTGGFYGSYGVGATYFPADEVAWAAKYHIDAELLAIQAHFNVTSKLYGTRISPRMAARRRFFPRVEVRIRFWMLAAAKGDTRR